MRELIKITLLIAMLLFCLIACETQSSVQQYYVTAKEQPAFVSMDLPASLLNPEASTLSGETQQILSTIHKVNFLALPVSSATEAFYQTEKGKVSELLSQAAYKQLFRMQTENTGGSVYYVGTEVAVDELILFGYKDGQGFVLIRLLGDGMNPAKILSVMDSLDMDMKALPVQEFKDIFEQVGFGDKEA
ncbi:MAG: DUF4252 domain-containing protein [Lutibacter sp.]|jgi:hypothetical protein|nr:DUF4252 domain-containing protein [Lutibacter sp.]